MTMWFNLVMEITDAKTGQVTRREVRQGNHIVTQVRRGDEWWNIAVRVA